MLNAARKRIAEGVKVAGHGVIVLGLPIGGFLGPAAGIDGVRHVLVLEPLSAQLPPIPELAASAPKAADKGGKAKASAGGAAP